jgi:hypothetical protein
LDDETRSDKIHRNTSISGRFFLLERDRGVQGKLLKCRCDFCLALRGLITEVFLYPQVSTSILKGISSTALFAVFNNTLVICTASAARVIKEHYGVLVQRHDPRSLRRYSWGCTGA